MNVDLFGNAIVEDVEYSTQKQSINPFDYVKHIGNKTRPETCEDYNPFLTNLSFSQRKDTVIYANEMNRYHNLGNLEQFDFYYHSLPKKNLFAKWNKKSKYEYVDAIKEYYGVSETVALSYEKSLTFEQKDYIIDFLSKQKGGKNK